MHQQLFIVLIAIFVKTKSPEFLQGFYSSTQSNKQNLCSIDSVDIINKNRNILLSDT